MRTRHVHVACACGMCTRHAAPGEGRGGDGTGGEGECGRQRVGSRRHLRAAEERGGAEEGGAVEQVEVARAQLRRVRQALRRAQVRRDGEAHPLEDLAHLRPRLARVRVRVRVGVRVMVRVRVRVRVRVAICGRASAVLQNHSTAEASAVSEVQPGGRGPALLSRESNAVTTCGRGRRGLRMRITCTCTCTCTRTCTCTCTVAPTLLLLHSCCTPTLLLLSYSPPTPTPTRAREGRLRHERCERARLHRGLVGLAQRDRERRVLRAQLRRRATLLQRGPRHLRRRAHGHVGAGGLRHGG